MFLYITDFIITILRLFLKEKYSFAWESYALQMPNSKRDSKFFPRSSRPLILSHLISGLHRLQDGVWNSLSVVSLEAMLLLVAHNILLKLGGGSLRFVSSALKEGHSRAKCGVAGEGRGWRQHSGWADVVTRPLAHGTLAGISALTLSQCCQLLGRNRWVDVALPGYLENSS